MTARKLLLTALKILGALILVVLIVAGIVLYRSANYEMMPLQTSDLEVPMTDGQPDYQKLAESLVAQMTLEEKLNQMSGAPRSTGMLKLVSNFFLKGRFPHVFVGENERLGIPPWVLSDGPRGARVLADGVKGVTTFPVAMSRGASWNPDLEYRINEVISAEMRANQTNYGATPCINLLRHPGWGRAQETYGEDPWLLGEFGLAAVKGIESNHVMACPKHFALNSIENSRWVVDVEVDERALREVYLPHFKKTLQQGKPASIMSAYNSVNGEFCGSNRHLLTEILRDDWGFEGFVSTDWLFGLYDGVGGVKAGLDVEMPFGQFYTLEVLQQGIADGEITEADIDRLVIRSLATRLKYATIDDQNQYPQSLIAQPSSIELAREAAEEGMVLLKNEGVLPFTKTPGKKTAVIGRLANLPNTGDQGSSDSKSLYVVTPHAGIQAYHGEDGHEVLLYDGTDVAIAQELAEEADEVIVVVGFTREDEGEYLIFQREQMIANAEAGQLVGDPNMGGDREDLRLRQTDEALIQALAGTHEQLAVVYIGGSAIDMSPWEDQVPAILFSWYAGMEGGHALANILYGETSPSGKLPFSIASDQADYPEFHPYTLSEKYGYYHGYTLFDKEEIEPAYPFGFGLSYASFRYDNLQVGQTELTETDTLRVTVELSNTSAISGKEVVQLYVGFHQSSVDRPVKLLRDFEKVGLQGQGTQTVTLEVPVKDLAWYNPDTKSWEVEQMDYEVYVGSSSAPADLLKAVFTVE
ncbi:glycoside hydrolase family 3 C-terminal domain-containing protein [Pontibacter sp. G13]|uniref:beta-glucosidase family protein n=1 Tax=Pontibacter sp. G13 TaxID=3074898 RepID=UPI00288922EB|nr:glycoside hydrolase family 3 C-terminal domain-containing protein [Pontibacter sp. G13]WNJ19489.1 glycoside hydrolase family 3 C-terminal domain-containing protein [Pontibacter sp. G13]